MEQMQNMLNFYEIISSVPEINNVKKLDASKLYSNKEFQSIYSFNYLDNLFEIYFPKLFPIELAKITLLDGGFHSHVDKRGVVCLPKQEDVDYDINDPEALIVMTINALKKLYSFTDAEEKKEIEIEYNDYLSFFDNYENKECLLFEKGDKGQLIIENNRYLLGINGLLLNKYLKDKKYTFHNYIILDLVSLPDLRNGRLTHEDIVSNLSQDSFKKLHNYPLSTFEQYYLLRYKTFNGLLNYLLIKTRTVTNTKKRNALLDSSSEIKVFSVRNVELEFLRERGGSNVYTDKVLVIGAGSVGSEVIEQMAATGFTNITIVDNDVMKYENGYRNCTGLWFQSSLNELPKADAVKWYINFKYPDVDCNSIAGDIVEQMDKRVIKLENYSYIISCTGNTIINKYINKYVYDNKIKTKLIFAWLEPYGIAEHILAINTEYKGCYECYSNSPNSINLAAGNEEYKIRNNVCSGSFTPYGRISCSRIASSITEIILFDKENVELIDNCHHVYKRNDSFFLNKGFKKTTNMLLSQEAIDEKSKDYIYRGCVVCGKCKDNFPE